MVVELLFGFSLHRKRFRGSASVTPELCHSSAQSLHDLISMTLMKGSGLLEELDSLIGLLWQREDEKVNRFVYWCQQEHSKLMQTDNYIRWMFECEGVYVCGCMY